MTNQMTLALTCSKSSLIIMFVGGHGTVAEDYYGVSAKSTMGRIEGTSPHCSPSHLPPPKSFMPIPPQYLIRRHRRQKNDWERVRPWLSPCNS